MLGQSLELKDGHIVRRRLAAMEIRDRPITARSPWQNVARLIARFAANASTMSLYSARATCAGSSKSYEDYHNRVQNHLSLNKDAPIHRAAHSPGTVVEIPILGGLHHHYVRI
jgi:hypothetical protein